MTFGLWGQCVCYVYNSSLYNYQFKNTYDEICRKNIIQNEKAKLPGYGQEFKSTS